MKKPNYFLFDIGKITAVFPSWLAIRTKRHYVSKVAKEKYKGSFIIASNHVAFSDWVKLFLVFPYRRIHVFTLTKAFGGKFKRFIFKKMLRCIEVDDYKMSMTAFKETANLVKYGKALALFPEGHIQDYVHDFKEGLAFIAAYNNIPIAPVYIKRRKNFFHMTHVYIGERVDPKDFVSDFRNREQLNALTTHLEQIVKSLELTANNS